MIKEETIQIIQNVTGKLLCRLPTIFKAQTKATFFNLDIQSTSATSDILNFKI